MRWPWNKYGFLLKYSCSFVPFVVKNHSCVCRGLQDPYGTTEEITIQVKERMDIFFRNGGYVFAPIHNIVAKVPPENIIAMYKACGNLNN